MSEQFDELGNEVGGFGHSCLEWAVWSAGDAAWLLAGVDPENHEWSEQEGHSFYLLPGSWPDKRLRNDDNILAAIETYRRLTNEAMEYGLAGNQSPRAWLEWAISRNVPPAWLDVAYRDTAMRRYLPPLEGAIPASDGTAGTVEAEAARYITKQFWSTAEEGDRATHPKKDTIRAHLKEKFPELSMAGIDRADRIARPQWARRGGRPPENL